MPRDATLHGTRFLRTYLQDDLPLPPPAEAELLTIPVPGPPPPPPMAGASDFGPDKVTAAFQFTAETEEYLSMNEGEYLTVVEQDLDSNGWTKVRSLESGGEGYVPTSYLNFE